MDETSPATAPREVRAYLATREFEWEVGNGGLFQYFHDILIGKVARAAPGQLPPGVVESLGSALSLLLKFEPRLVTVAETN